MIPVIAVISCWKNHERRFAIRKTWAKLAVFPVKFIVGRPTTADDHATLAIAKDVISVDAPDGYIGLPSKIHAAVAKLRGFYSHILKVDDDVFVAADRLVVPAQEYVGKVVRNTATHPWYCHGGAGYWLGPDAATAVAKADPPGWLSEDAFVASSVTNAGIGLTSSPKFNVEEGPDRWKKLPRMSNDFVTCGGFDPWELRRAFDLYQRDNRDEEMTADEYRKKISGQI